MSRIFSFLATLLLTIRAIAGDVVPVKVTEAWVRAVPPVSTASAAFMRLENTGDEPLRLVGATTPIAAMAMPMITTRKTVEGVEVLGMKGVDFIEVPPHAVHELKPGGDHLMLMNLTSHPHPGDTISLSLHFEPGHRIVTVEVPAHL